MLTFEDFFATYARLSRKQIAIYADVAQTEIDELANDLDLPERLTLTEAQQLLAVLEGEDEDEEPDPDGNDEVDDDEDEAPEEEDEE